MTEHSHSQRTPYSPQTFTDAYPDIPNASGSPKGEKSSFKSDSLDDVLPPAHDYRTLVLCFDGTGDQFDADVCVDGLSLLRSSPSHQNSNIVQFFSMLKKDDPSEQMVYYQVLAHLSLGFPH